MRVSKLVAIATMTVVLQTTLSTAVHAGSDWEFSITPFVWVAGLDCDIGSILGLPPEDVSLSFGDILDDLDYGGFLYATARNGSWVLFLEASAVQTTTQERVCGDVVDSVEVVSQTSNMALAVGRTISQSDQYNVDAYVGARAWWLDNDTKVKTRRKQVLARSRVAPTRAGSIRWFVSRVSMPLRIAGISLASLRSEASVWARTWSGA